MYCHTGTDIISHTCPVAFPDSCSITSTYSVANVCSYSSSFGCSYSSADHAHTVAYSCSHDCTDTGAVLQSCCWPMQRVCSCTERLLYQFHIQPRSIRLPVVCTELRM